MTDIIFSEVGGNLGKNHENTSIPLSNICYVVKAGHCSLNINAMPSKICFHMGGTNESHLEVMVVC